MKKNLLVLLFLTIFIGGCSSVAAYDETKLIPVEEHKQLFVKPEEYINQSINMHVWLEAVPEYDKEKDGFFSFGVVDEEMTNYVSLRFNEEQFNTFEFKAEQYLNIQGVIETNLEVDGKVYPRISVTNVAESNYIDAFAPAIETIEVNSSVEQHGVTIKTSKVEFAEKETRVFLDIANNAKNTFTFYAFNNFLQMNGTKLEGDNYISAFYESGDSILDGDVLPGESISGYVIFGPIKASDEEKIDLRIETSGFTDNYDIEFEDYTFKIK